MDGNNNGKYIGLTILFGILFGLFIVPFFFFGGCLGGLFMEEVNYMGGGMFIVCTVLGVLAGIALSFFLGSRVAKAICAENPPPQIQNNPEEKDVNIPPDGGNL